MIREKGVFYIAIGEAMLPKLGRSVESVRRFLDLPITVITDLPDIGIDADEVIHVRWGRRITYAVKPEFMGHLPYDRCLFLDCDTVVLRSDAAGPLDLITERYGYLAAAVHGNFRCWSQVDPVIGCAASINSGVLFFRKCSKIQQVISRWKAKHREGGGDQIGLTRALLRCRVPTYYLPPEFNWRGQRLLDESEIRIVHHESYFEINPS